MTETSAQFGPYHLSWLIRNGQMPQITVLGAVPSYEPPEFSEGIGLQLYDWHVIDEEGKITPEADELIRGLYDYDYSFWGVLLLLNEQEPFELEVDADLLRWGVGLSLIDIPRVFWQVSVRKGEVIVAMRAGDVVTINPQQPDINLDRTIAKGILSVLDPLHNWPASTYGKISIPLDVLTGIPTYDSMGNELTQDVQVRRVRTSLMQAGIDTDTVTKYCKLMRVENLAKTDIVFSPSPSEISLEHFDINFLHEVGMSLTYRGKDIEGRDTIVHEAANESNIARQIDHLRRGPSRRSIVA